jgi:Domain of unknown function (DUF4833)
MIIRFKSMLVWLIIMVMGSVAFANNPLPTNKSDDLLFTIGRSRDTDEIVYELNIDDSGQVIKSNPIKIKWIRNTDHQKIEPLTFIQQQYAYGIEFLDQEENTKNKWRFQFVSYSKRTFILRQTENSSYKVFTKIDNKEVELNRIYIQFVNRSFWFPSISAIEIYGKLDSFNNCLAEVLKP